MKHRALKQYIFFILTVNLFLFCSGFAFSQDEAETRDDYASGVLSNYITTFYNSLSNGFPSDEANTVIQTRDGYMWFGGYSGLVRYDGKKYTIWDAVSSDDFTSSNVRSLHEGQDGTLWIGTNDKGLVAYKNGVFTTYDKDNGLPSNLIRCIAESTDGRVYCGTPDGLFYIDADRKITTVEFDTETHPFIVSISCDSENNVYAVLNSGELFAYSRNGVAVQYSADVRFGAVAAVSSGRVIAGAQGSIIITGFDGEQFTRHETRATPLRYVTQAYEDSKGRVWFTAENGVGFLDSGENYHNVGDPGGVGFYTAIYEDYQNGYWITGTKGGVVKFTVSAFTDMNALYGFPRGAVNALLMDNGYTYIGTDDGLFILDEKGNPVRTEFSGRIKTHVRGIFRDSTGNIWICTYANFGAIRYNPETGAYKNWLPKDGLSSELVRCMVELPNGIIVLGSREGVDFIKGDTLISAHEALGIDAATPLELPTITVLSMVVSTDGTLYIGTDGSGIYAVNKNGTTRYQEEEGLPGGVVLRMHADPNKGGVWVAAAPGLSYIDGNKRINVIEKVPSYSFLDILRLGDDLVLLTSSLIIRSNADLLLDETAPFEYSAVDKSAGLTASINANAWNVLTEDGSLFFCCASGISKYNFESSAVPFIPYAGAVKISVDGEAYTDFTQTIVLPKDSDRLTIELSLLSFGLLDNAKLYYRLIGQDATPHSLAKGGNLDVSYTNLEGGKYTLSVWTEDSLGNRGNAFEINLQKELKLTERVITWVVTVILAAFLVAMLIFAIVKFNARKARQKQREYRTIITQALTAIANAIDAKDNYTSGHSARVAAYSVELARRLDMDKNAIENLYYIGLLHDVGKIGVPNSIINKPDKLTDEEYGIMKQHPGIGREILKDITTITHLAAGAAEHHERWDGKGYSNGLSGKDISLEGRIIAVADTYDAMSSNRSYRASLSKDVIIAEFKRCKGSQFDPDIAEIAINMIERELFGNINVAGIIDTIH